MSVTSRCERHTTGNRREASRVFQNPRRLAQRCPGRQNIVDQDKPLPCRVRVLRVADLEGLPYVHRTLDRREPGLGFRIAAAPEYPTQRNSRLCRKTFGDGDRLVVSAFAITARVKRHGNESVKGHSITGIDEALRHSAAEKNTEVICSVIFQLMDDSLQDALFLKEVPSDNGMTEALPAEPLFREAKERRAGAQVGQLLKAPPAQHSAGITERRPAGGAHGWVDQLVQGPDEAGAPRGKELRHSRRKNKRYEPAGPDSSFLISSRSCAARSNSRSFDARIISRRSSSRRSFF